MALGRTHTHTFTDERSQETRHAPAAYITIALMMERLSKIKQMVKYFKLRRKVFICDSLKICLPDCNFHDKISQEFQAVPMKK